MKKKEWGSILFFGAGLLLFLFLLYEMDWAELERQFATLRLDFVVFLMAYTFIWRFCHAWAFSILCGLPQVKIGSYVATQILSNTVSDLFFVGNTGGEVYRAYKMAEYYPQHRQTFWGMTLLYNVYYGFAMILVFVSSGIFLTLVWKTPGLFKIIFLILIVLFFLLCMLVLYWQSRGLLSPVLGLIGKFPFEWSRKLGREILKRTIPIDRAVKNFHRKNPTRTLAFIFLMYISRLLTIGEFLIIAAAMGIHMNFSSAVFINVVDSFVRIAFFLVPNGQIGVLEAVMTSVGGVIGQDPTVMFTIALVQRIRVIFWDAIGLGIMGWEKKRGKLYGSSLDA